MSHRLLAVPEWYRARHDIVGGVNARTCKGCKKTKPIDDFYKGKYRCKVCTVQASNDWRSQNPERSRALGRARYARSPDKFKAAVRSSTLKAKYGLTPEQYDAMLAAQGGHCAICPATEPGGGNKKFNVDHDHVTGKVRGLLCRSCNLMLGYSEDSEERLEAGIAYLRASRRPKLEVVNG
jgi:Autographiviridae endonuclease VII